MKKTYLLFTLMIITCTTSYSQFTTIKTFNNVSGSPSSDTVISDGTFLYGTTVGNLGIDSAFGGTIYKIRPDGTDYSTVYVFPNFIRPSDSLFFDGTYFYGITEEVLFNNILTNGTIFKVKPDGTGYQTLMTNQANTNPSASLISDGTFLYGMTRGTNVNNDGTIFKIKLDGTGYLKLFDFTRTTTGANPLGSLVSDGTFLYGFTYVGGTYDGGTIFKIKLDGTDYTKLIDLDITTSGDGPVGSLIIDGMFLYGMTPSGGKNNLGTIFKIKLDGTNYTKLMDFAGENGSKPNGGLVYDGTFLYGMTKEGGVALPDYAYAYGTIFKIKPDGTNYTKLKTFTPAYLNPDGQFPAGSLFSDGTFLYGRTSNGGGGANRGVLFKQCQTTVTVSVASSSPTLCVNTTLTNITHTTTGVKGIGSPTNLPTGVTAAFKNNTVTISGIPTSSGRFVYSIPLTGGCQSLNATGIINVNPNTVSAASSSPTLCINTVLANITHKTTGATNIGSHIGLPVGVTATFSNNTITISGTPTVSGIFNYSIPLTGGCGSVNATGTIIVTPANTVSVASSSPILCINSILTNITHTTTGATEIGTPTGFPTGVSASFTNNTITISGTPTVSGTFNYSIPLTGGCGSVNATGTIIIIPLNTVTVASTTPTLCINTALTNIMHVTTGATGIGSSTGLPTGVSAAFSSNTITISGTATVSGTFNYSIPLTGGCGSMNAIGTIVVKANNTVGAASSTPTLCINTALNNITHATSVATGIGSPIGLPTGLITTFANNTITISGSPKVSGTFNYSIPLTGGCSNVNATGIIIVTPANTVTPASSAPTLCINTALTNITHTTIGATGIGSPTGLPIGLNVTFANNTITISGTPTVSGTFNYSIPLIGGCGSVNATGIIIVKANNTITTVSSSPTLCINTVLNTISHSTTGAIGIGSPTGLQVGLIATFTNNTITISGTPNTSGIFNYSIPLTGGCGSVNATGTITVKANNTVGAASSAPTLCINTALTNITHATIGATSIGSPIGLPTGLSATFANNTITISGTPTVSGTFSFNIPLAGGCGSVNAIGTITVIPANTASATSSTLTQCINTALTNITHTTTGATSIGSPTGLPTGLSATFANNTITISGTPTVSGTFNYSIPLIGGCGSVNATGTLNLFSTLAANISADGIVATNTNITNGNVVPLQLNGSLNAVPNIQWTPATSISSTSLSNLLVYPSSTTTYTANFINIYGCPQTTSIQVNVTPQPTLGTLSLTSSNTTAIGLFDTINVDVQLTGATNLYSLFMKLKGNAAVNQYLDYSGFTASTLMGSNLISTPPTVTNNVCDFGITKVGPSIGYSGSGLFYNLRFVPKNISIPDGTVFCFYLDNVNAYNNSGISGGLTNQGQYCFTFTNKVNVWPGDLNNSQTVGTADLLPIGYFYNATGPARPNATIQWSAQPITLWGYDHSYANRDAYKVFADSNGDGVINNADQAAIGFNMSKNHARLAAPITVKKNNTAKLASSSGGLIVTPSTALVNATLPQKVTFTVSLNNSGGLGSLYGISVNLLFDNTIFDLSTATIDYTGSIFGITGTNCLVMNYTSSNMVSVGLTRYANAAINGQGLLFKVTLQTKSPMTSTLTKTPVTAYADAANNQTGDTLVVQDAPIVYFDVINTLGVETLKSDVFMLYPNPTNDVLYLVLGTNTAQNNNLKLKVINMLGQTVNEMNIQSSTTEVFTRDWGPSGVYFVEVSNTDNAVLMTKKIIVQRK